MIKFLRIASIASILIFVVLAVYGNNKFKQIDYDLNSNDFKYTPSFYEDFIETESDFAKEIIDDDTIKSIEDLIEQSDIIMKVKPGKNKIRKGEGIINNCKIIDKYKVSKELTKKDNILIYDFAIGISSNAIGYNEGSKPLDYNNEYIVFLKKAIHPNMKDTYVFSSVNFGSFPIKQTNNYLTNYGTFSITIKDSYNYDYISRTDRFFNTYKRILQELDSVEQLKNK